MNMTLKTFAASIALATLHSAVSASDFGTTTMKILHPWARVTVPGQSVGTAFMTLENTSATPERLLGATTPAADHVELHTMSMEGSTMKMRQVAGIDIPPGKTVSLTPESTHVMLQGLKAPLAIGAHVPMTLHFEKAGDVQLDLKIEPMSFRMDAPMR